MGWGGGARTNTVLDPSHMCATNVVLRMFPYIILNLSLIRSVVLVVSKKKTKVCCIILKSKLSLLTAERIWF